MLNVVAMEGAAWCRDPRCPWNEFTGTFGVRSHDSVLTGEDGDFVRDGVSI